MPPARPALMSRFRLQRRARTDGPRVWVASTQGGFDFFVVRNTMVIWFSGGLPKTIWAPTMAPRPRGCEARVACEVFGGDATMHIVVGTPISVEKLPVEVRGNFPDGTLVRVSLELVRDENGFAPEKADELRQALTEVRQRIDRSPSFDNADDLIAYLHAECQTAE